ncbi:MAG: hypothetical protein QXU79_00055 [Candidatus Micrarchaeaceae archaeon]
MIPAASFAIDPRDGDLAVDPVTGQVRMVTGTEEVAQGLTRRLRLWEGEFFWDARDGVPWHLFFGKDFDAVRLHYEILAEVHRDRRLDRVVDCRVVGFDPATRTVTVLVAAIFRGEVVRAALEVSLNG